MADIGIRPDAGHAACFLCRRQGVEGHRLCSNCAALQERRSIKAAVNPAGLFRVMRPFVAASFLPAPYRREK